MDFIMDLWYTDGYIDILVVVDRFSKIAHFISPPLFLWWSSGTNIDAEHF